MRIFANALVAIIVYSIGAEIITIIRKTKKGI
jgi:hypothetical protein